MGSWTGPYPPRGCSRQTCKLSLELQLAPISPVLSASRPDYLPLGLRGWCFSILLPYLFKSSNWKAPTFLPPPIQQYTSTAFCCLCAHIRRVINCNEQSCPKTKTKTRTFLFKFIFSIWGTTLPSAPPLIKASAPRIVLIKGNGLRACFVAQ